MSLGPFVILAGVLSALELGWSLNWPDTPPIADQLRNLHPDRWVRFHALPESKRYPDTESEYATVLDRHQSVLNAMGLKGTCFVLSARFTSDISPALRPGSRVQPRAERWRTVPPGEGTEIPTHVYASEVRYPSDELDLLLRRVADERLSGAIIVPADISWIYHPYDGGGDLIARSTHERNSMSAIFSSWLSQHPQGL